MFSRCFKRVAAMSGARQVGGRAEGVRDAASVITSRAVTDAADAYKRLAAGEVKWPHRHPAGPTRWRSPVR